MAKTPSNDRAAKAKKQLKAHQRAERRGSFMIVGVCGVVALLIVAAAAYRPVMNWWELRQFNDIDLASIGEPATTCGPEQVLAATGNQDHQDEGDIAYETSPAIFGPHRSVPAPMERKFYGWDEAPEVEQLVHNLEHGYTFLWYDQTAWEDDEMMDEIRGIASKLKGTDNFRLKFKAAPWKGEEDGGTAFPEGQHIAIAHWASSAEPAVGDAPDELPEEGDSGFGVVQYCSAPSGEALEDFMLRWPYTNSWEPNAM
ncbi:DUF3105 domain-containing protein [Nocardioides sp. CPCC 205120]|uniref:DUF3105 domain-containing protein n=1 Tax=Nocardioides sp. CPCC 205120 TaxID=3406462 RepID=UPI003B50D820